MLCCRQRENMQLPFHHHKLSIPERHDPKICLSESLFHIWTVLLCWAFHCDLYQGLSTDLGRRLKKQTIIHLYQKRTVSTEKNKHWNAKFSNFHNKINAVKWEFTRSTITFIKHQTIFNKHRARRERKWDSYNEVLAVLI